MVDTVRTDSDIMGLWADNTDGQISAQDARDGYVTLRGVAGVGAEETASFTLALSHLGKLIRCNHAATPIVVTIPTNASVPFPTDSILNFAQWGAANVSFVSVGSPASVAIRHASTLAAQIRGQYSVVSLWKVASDEWLLFGGLADA